MSEGREYHQAVLQNLIDAGCDEAFVEQFFTLQASGRGGGQIKLLCVHRKQLLERLHECGRQLDCLDYLLYELRKERCEP